MILNARQPYKPVMMLTAPLELRSNEPCSSPQSSLVSISILFSAAFSFNKNMIDEKV